MLPHALEIEIGRVVEDGGTFSFVADTNIGYNVYTHGLRDPLQEAREVAKEKGLALEPGAHKEEVGRNYYTVVKK